LYPSLYRPRWTAEGDRDQRSVTIRDFETAAIGALLSFGISLATIKNPSGFLRWGFIVSLVFLIVFAVADFVTRPWLSAEVIPILETPEGTVVQIGIENHGRRPTESMIFNVLVPDHLPFVACRRDGTPRDDRELLPTPESVDNLHASLYWQGAMVFAPGSTLVYLRLGLPRPGSFIRLNLGEKRRDAFISPNALNQSALETTFAPFRSAIWDALGPVAARLRDRR
jgi:hypothetical protein